MVAGVAVVAALLVASGAVAALLLTGGSGGGGSQAPTSGKGYLGLSVTALPSQGLRVASVQEGGPAAKAGIQTGDLILSVDGQVVKTPEQLKSVVEAKAPGTTVTITFDRGDQEMRATVKLGEAPAGAQIEATPPPAGQQPPAARAPGQGLGRGELGVQIQNITPQLKQRYNLTRDSGIVVTNVVAGSPAALAGIQPGDIILSVNGTDVTTAEQLTRAIVTAGRGQTVTLQVLRGNDMLTFKVQPDRQPLFPGFENLPQQIQDRLEQLAQARNLTPEQLQRLAQGQNYLRVGTVKAIDSASITITPMEGGADVTYTLNDKTEYRHGADQASFSDVQPGKSVIVLSLDGQTALGVFLLQR
jgi:membrane-associated protease RseP (regulator of RpoE activity)